MYRKFNILILLFLAVKFSAGQLPDFHPVRLNKTNGLSSNQIYCFFQDHNGFMWIGTDNGLNRYDGYSFDVYKKIPHDSTSLLSNGISCIAEDKDNILWIGHATGGISCYNAAAGKFTSFEYKVNDTTSLQQGGISAIYIDKENNVWIAVQLQALTLFDRKTKSFIHYNPLPDINPAYGADARRKYNSIYKIWEDENGLLWLAGHNGLYTFDKKKKIFTPVRNKPIVAYQWRDDLYNVLHPSKDGMLWLGAWGGGLTRYNRKTGEWKIYKYNPVDKWSATHNIVFGVEYKSPTELWISTPEKGLGIFNIREEKFYFGEPDKKSKDEPSIYGGIYSDRDGNTWFSHNLGIDLIHANANLFSFTEFPVAYSTNGKFYGVHGFYRDTVDHLLFVGTSFADGLHVINEVTGEHKTFKFGTVKSEEDALVVSDIIKDHAGTIWISTRDFLYHYDVQNKKLIDIPQPPVDTAYRNAPYFYRMMEDHAHIIWITTLRHGIYKFDPATYTYTHYDHSDNDTTTICSHYIISMAEDKQQNMWFGSGSGLSRYVRSKNIFENYFHNDRDSLSIPNDVVSGIVNDSKSDLWLSTYGGLSKVIFNGDKVAFSNITSVNGLTAETIGDLICDGEGNLWFTCPDGLGMRDVSGGFRYYTNNDGLKNEYTSLSLFKTDDGEIFMGIFAGYFRFYPSNILRKENIPAVSIKSFKVFDKEKFLFFDKPIYLAWSDNFFSFDFTSINFSNPEKTRYAYMLEGFDKDWVFCGNRRYASYTNLDGGNYVFKVKAQNADGQWGTDMAIPLHIKPPFWKTSWFIVLISIAASLIIYGIYFLRIRSIRKTEKLKTEFNKKIAEVEMRALRAQMNPHFIFNCLNSINRYIVKSDTKTASLYLTKFSKLIRLILDNSENKNVTLSSEIESLKLYIDMESIRFENKFSFEVKVNDDVNAENISVPPLIIQPYVENAIWHGLLNKETAGKLFVAVSRHNSTLECVVEDDGVGRSKAKELKSKSATTRKSLGMKITEDRLTILNEHAEKKSSVEIIDLKDKSGNGCGTRVIIKIPMSEN